MHSCPCRSFLADPDAWLKSTPIYDASLNVYTYNELMSLHNANSFEFSYVTGPNLFASAVFQGDFSHKLTTEELRNRTKGDPIVNGTSMAKVL